MSKALDRAVERCVPGARLEVLESTYRPELNGTTRTITGRDRVSRRLLTCTSSHTPAREHAMELPRANLEWLDDDTIRYPIGRKGTDGTAHTITMRFVSPR
jgi:hypothetical protein